GAKPAGDLHCALDVAPPCQATEMTLAASRPPADQRLRLDRAVRDPADRVGEETGLIEAPQGKAGPVQRHRDDQRAIGDELGARPRHPACETGCQLGAIGMLETEDQIAALVVIAEDGAGTLIGRAFHQAGAAKRARRGFELERLAATGATGRREPGELQPTGRAKAVLAAENVAAFQAARRQYGIEGGTKSSTCL